MYEIEFDPLKRELALKVHKVDFKDAVHVFAGRTFSQQDNRTDYGEHRIVTFGVFQRRMIVVVWTPRGDVRRVISMRKANEREQRRYSHELGGV